MEEEVLIKLLVNFIEGFIEVVANEETCDAIDFMEGIIQSLRKDDNIVRQTMHEQREL